MKKIHLIGIGGISMSGIAEMLKSFNYEVSGTDINDTELIQRLINEGFNIKIGHHPEMIKETDTVVYTAAIKDDDPELIEARKLNKDTFERAEFLGKLSELYQNCICISGTHGKSTTTGMVSTIFLEAKKDPTIQIGANLPIINSNSYIGSKDYLVMEACEYVDSFLHFKPTSEIILNIDDDHLDYFKNIDNIKKSFTKYLNLLPKDGFAIVNIDNQNTKDILKDVDVKYYTYGINEEADYQAINIKVNDLGCYSFDVLKNKQLLTNIELTINGYHNIYNALASLALADNYQIPIDIIKSALLDYHGVDRRFQLIGKYNDALVYDDYAHHPTEIKTTLESTKSVKHNSSWAIFQSHTYSRTKQHLDEFASVLAGFDHVIIAKIYPARETNTFNVSEDMLVDKIKETNPNAIYIDDFAKIVDYLKENVKPGDIVITVGAGPVNKVAYELVTK